jgi:hypothetical protein
MGCQSSGRWEQNANTTTRLSCQSESDIWYRGAPSVYQEDEVP